MTRIFALIAAAVLVALPAQAADQDFCRDYATSGVRQARTALDHSRCWDRIVPGLRESRWSRDYHVHYDWCRGVSREEADRERNLRTHYLEECRHW